MGYSGALLHQISNPRPLQIKTPDEVASQGMQLRSLARQNQVGELNLHNAQQEQRDAELKRQLGTQIIQAVVKHQGDWKAVYGDIAQIPGMTPELLMSYKKLADDQDATA